MKSEKYLALLRGINVGGNNIIKMATLRTCFEEMRFDNVRTYIQSGNVIFNSAITNEAEIEHTIEKALSKKFKYKARIVVIPQSGLERIVAKAPKQFGKEPEKFRYDFIFLKKPLTPEKAMKAIEIRDSVDSAQAGEQVIYFLRLTSKLTGSRVSNHAQKTEKQYINNRKWNTTTKLLALMEVDD